MCRAEIFVTEFTKPSKWQQKLWSGGLFYLPLQQSKMRQHVLSQEHEGVTTSHQCYMIYTGCLFDKELRSKLRVWFFSRCPDRLPSIWSTTAAWLLARRDHLIPECVVFHGRTTVSVTADFSLPVHTCGTIFPRTFDKPIWVTNISNGIWKLICLEITAHCDFFIFAPLILLLTYLHTAMHQNQSKHLGPDNSHHWMDTT